MQPGNDSFGRLSGYPDTRHRLYVYIMLLRSCFFRSLDWNKLGPPPPLRFLKTFLRSRRWQRTSMAPYIVISHVQCEINAKAPVSRKTATKSRMLWRAQWESLRHEPRTTIMKLLASRGSPTTSVISWSKWIMHETDDAGDFSKLAVNEPQNAGQNDFVVTLRNLYWMLT